MCNKDVSKTITASSLGFGHLIEIGESINWLKRWWLNHAYRQANGLGHSVS